MVAKNSSEQDSKLRKLTDEVIHLRDRERILLNKLDRSNDKLASIYGSPLSFALARLYHRYIKKDEKNV